MPECHSGGACQDWYKCTMYPDKADCPYKKEYEDNKRATLDSTEFAGSALRVFIGHVQAAKSYLDNPDMGNKNYGKASMELRKATKLMPLVLKENE